MRNVAVLALAAFAIGCSREPQPPAQPPPGPAASPQLTGLPVEMTVRQRTTTPVPGSSDELRLTIDDITRNQVIVSLAPKAGGILLAPTSLAPGGSASFPFGNASYVLTLKTLAGSLLGQDFATFVFSAAAPGSLKEEEKIERLIETVAGMKDATFIRNGAEHDPREAADHLRSKWRAQAGEIRTAAQFIDVVASRSSLSGEPYRIRLAGGRVVDSGDYLRERLAELEQVR